MTFSAHPLTPDRWADFEAVMGANGACAGCWCMWWRLKRKDWDAAKGAGNKAAYRTIVDAGPPPGLIGYVDGAPVAWVQVGPRGELPTLGRSPVLARVDDRPVWSISCFFVRAGHRRRGYGRQLIAAAVEYARRQGAGCIEAYPWDRAGKQASGSIFTGVATSFTACGFTEAARRAPHRPIMRLEIGAG